MKSDLMISENPRFTKVTKTTSEIDNLQKANEELRETIRMLQQPIGLKQSPSKSVSQMLNEAHREKLSTNRKSESTKETENQNEKLKMENANLVTEMGDLKSAENRAHMKLLEMEKDLEKLNATNEQLLAEINSRMPENDQFVGKDFQGLKDLSLKNEELRTANEQLLRKIGFLELDDQRTPSSANEKQTKEPDDLISGDVKKTEIESVNLKLENEKLVAEIGKLKNSENCSHMSVLEMENELKKLTAINEQLSAELGAKKLEKDLLLAKELDGMPPDLRDLALKNEELRNDNENLLLKIRRLEGVEKSTFVSDDLKTTKLSPTQNKEENEAEPDWVPSNEDLVAEIEKLQQSKTRSNLSIRQMEKDLKKLESINENLLAQLKDKEDEIKQFSIPQSADNILQQNEELKALNGNMSVEISELKNSANLARSNEADMKKELENLAAVNKTLMAEINRLKQTDANTLEKRQALDEKNVSSEKGDLTGPDNTSHISILQIGKDLERLAALNESLLALNDTDIDQRQSQLAVTAPDVHQLLKKNQESKSANESLAAKIRELQNTENQAHVNVIESKNRLETLAAANERLQAQIKELERSSSNDRRVPPDMHMLKSENEKLKSANNNLMEQIAFLEEKLQNSENRTASYLNASSTNEQQYAKERTQSSLQPGNDYNIEIDWMVADMKKLQSKNESLRATNEKLLSQISDCANRSNSKDEIKNDLEKILDRKESDAQLIYSSNRNIEIEWMKTDMDVLQKKNEKLKSTNESLVAEIIAVKSAEGRSHKNVQQMERDLLRVSAMNERLSSQLNEKRLDKKQLLKARSEEVDAVTTDSADLLNKIEELTNSNECLASEITEMKNLDIVKLRNDLRKLSSTNESLKLQISELKLLSSNDMKLESDWMAADMKKLVNRNKKLNISNQNLVTENNELRREFRSLENRANMNAMHKLKELEKLTALNETLKDQINIQKNARANEIGLDAFSPDVKKVQKKNDELKAANEKLLSVIINLKNSEKLASSKATELEKELKVLQETNIHLQDTIENYVEKDWSKPKSELERICQLILNEGVCSLADAEFQYMYKWFCKSAPVEFEIPKTSRKNTARKHCRTCHHAADAYDNVCDCKQYEGKFVGKIYASLSPTFIILSTFHLILTCRQIKSFL